MPPIAIRCWDHNRVNPRRFIMTVGNLPGRPARIAIAHMPITGVHYQDFLCYATSGGGETNLAPWTVDWNLSPSMVFAVCSLNNYQGVGGGIKGAATGILSYETQDPDTQIPSEHAISTGIIYIGGQIEPCFFDDNVITITFAYNCYADDGILAGGSMTAFVFG